MLFILCRLTKRRTRNYEQNNRRCRIPQPFLISVGYAKDNSQVNEDSKDMIDSIYTDLSQKACTEVQDVDDPNETSYQLCPGAAGYVLIKRNADGGQSIDAVTPKKKKVPLDYWDFVTRRFSHLGDKAEWRVTRKTGA